MPRLLVLPHRFVKDCIVGIAVFQRLAESLSIPALSHQPLEQCVAMQQWLISGGGYVHPNAEISIYPEVGGFGLRAKEAISASTLLCVVPQSMCFHSSGPRAIADVTTELAIEKHKGISSRFSPFIETLPLDVSFMPALWSEEKLVEISGSQVEKDARAMKSEWLRTAEEEVANHPNGGFTVGDWLWARATVQSRAISFRKAYADKHKPISELRTIVAFLPYITIANHHDVLGCATAMGNGVTYPDSSFTFTSESKHYPGQQIYNSYGSISFQQKALSFGWIDRSTEVGSFCITVLDLPSADGINQDGDGLSIKQIELKTNIVDRRGGDGRGTISNAWAAAKQKAAIADALTLTKREVRRALREFQESGKLSKFEAQTRLQQALSDRSAFLQNGAAARGVIDSNCAESLELENLAIEGLSVEVESDCDCIRRVELEAVESLIRQLQDEKF